jgi:hypothetical protein
MEIAAILQAKSMAFMEPVDLNSKGKVFWPDLVNALVARYNFQKFPQKPEDADRAKGITFGMGRLGDTVIEDLVFLPFGIVLGTRVSTEESKRLLEEAFRWGSKELGLAITPVIRWQYDSQLTFYSKVPLLAIHPGLQTLSNILTKNAAEILGEDDLKYDLTAIAMEFDALKRKYTLGRFSIQRRENTPFSENKFFSEAPLPTSIHLKALEEFEASIAARK